mmetsp:Transcript_4355/g.13212  ORF Transcript_4355/g.13212 Transcript_4355/m.13212 type:complete len:231 (-) Transcript_4355:497-1189(-)
MRRMRRWGLLPLLPLATHAVSPDDVPHKRPRIHAVYHRHVAPIELVEPAVDPRVLGALGVQVVRHHPAALLGGGDGEGPNTARHIQHNLPLAELLLDEPVVLVLQPAVPVHLREVELKPNPVLHDDGLHLARASDHFHWQNPKLVLYLRGLVHHRPDPVVLIHDDPADQPLVRQLLVAQVQVRDVAHGLEARRNVTNDVPGQKRGKHLVCGQVLVPENMCIRHRLRQAVF